MRLLLLSLFTLAAHSGALPGTATLTGTVLDAATGEPLAAANVRILGTSRGTIANTTGVYSISLPGGEYRILFSMLGYAPDTVSIHLEGDMRRDVRMRPSDIVLPEIVVSSEDPAMGIIRRAIASKTRWIERLGSYEMQAFTRGTVFRDTAVAAISESYTKGYWQKGDTLREIVMQRRQTANVQAGFNFASVGRILNFLDDRISLLGFTFVGPTALDALDYYDYKLLRTRTSGGNDVYDIRMIPRTRTAPLFDGTVNIAAGSYALVGIDVQPNDAFQPPFVNDVYLRYRQQFGMYESSYWMPSDIRINAAVSLSVPGFSLPRIGMVQTSVISDYAINTTIPDSIFKRPRLVVDSSAARIDSSYWAANVVLPLDSLEQRAYRTLDSTQSLEVQFRPGGAMMTLGAGDGGFWKAVSFADLSFNRVEGLHAGIRADFDSVTESFSVRTGLAYGLSSRLGTYLLGGTYYPVPRRRLGFGADIYRIVDEIPGIRQFDPFLNSLSALIAKEDAFDYFSAEGWKGFVTLHPSDRLRCTLAYVSERQGPLSQRTSYSIMYPSRLFRPNPAAAPGRLSELRLEIHLGPEPVPLDLIQQNSFDLAIEHAARPLTGGDFDFTRVEGALTLTVPTFGQDYLLKPGFRIRASGGDAFGTLPVQRVFSVEAVAGLLARFGAMKGARPREYSGTGYASVAIEHNFRTLPLLALGIPFLYRLNIDLIVFGGAARAWTKDPPPGATHEGTYAEAGFSIGRILQLFRADFAWRLTGSRGLYFTVGVATLF
jgi:hypothetical protein